LQESQITLRLLHGFTLMLIFPVVVAINAINVFLLFFQKTYERALWEFMEKKKNWLNPLATKVTETIGHLGQCQPSPRSCRLTFLDEVLAA